MTRTVFACIRVPGFHHWPNAPEDVHYLASSHRHLFTIRAEWKVYDTDREVEFHLAQRELRRLLQERFYTHNDHGFLFGAMSCEMIAEVFLSGLAPQPSAVEVWEDDENGARVER